MCLPRCLRGLMRSLSKSVRGLLRCTSPVVAQSGEGQGVEFTSAFGGVAEVHGRTASAAFDANDPNRTSALRSGHPQFRCCLCLPARLFSSPQNSCAPSAVNQYVAPTGGVSASHTSVTFALGRPLASIAMVAEHAEGRDLMARYYAVRASRS